MKKDKIPEESSHILEQELITITDKLEELRNITKDIQDLKLELRGLKLFLGKVHPEFNKQFPVIMKKFIKKA